MSKAINLLIKTLQGLEPADVTGVSLTQTANGVTANGSVTVADGATPSNDEIYELAIEIQAVQDDILTEFAKIKSALAAADLSA